MARLWESRYHLAGTLVSLLMMFCALVGCHRDYYRRQADSDVCRLLTEKSVDPRWALPTFSVQPNPQSRFFDPSCPSHPAMPEDDPAARYLSPKPQVPVSVQVPLESTAYLDLLPLVEDPDASVRRSQFDPLAEEGETPRLITSHTAYELGLLNSRDYQDRKESLYLAALDVSQERFAFGPQLFAAQQLIYKRITRQASAGGTSVSELSTEPDSLSGTIVVPGDTPGSDAPDGQTVRRFEGLGPMAGTGFGAGKLFTTGGALLLRFANDTALEFSGPLKGALSRSEMTLDVVQPLLQGGGRAVTLEPLTQSERNLLYELRSYARFQREFFVSIATGARLNQGARLENSQQSDEDPNGKRRRVGLLPLIEQLQVLGNEQRNLELLRAHLARFVAFQRAGEASSIQVDQVRQNVAQARSRVLRARRRYFANLDRFKIQLGLPTGLPLVIDDGLLAQFELDETKCRLANLPEQLPPLEYGRDEAINLALENRLDLMNARGLLVDHWRKIAVSANGLLGVADLEYHGSWLTPNPVGTSRPLAFSGQRTSHRVTIKGELPLVRMEERNVYRATLIEYQQARRTLMETVDVIRWEVRNELRELQRAREDFEIQRQAVILACRRVDQTSRILELPPRQGERRELGTNSARDLLEAQQDLVDAQNDLVRAWVDYQTVRLELLRDLELLDVHDASITDLGTPARRGTSAPEELPVPPGTKAG